MLQNKNLYTFQEFDIQTRVLSITAIDLKLAGNDKQIEIVNWRVFNL